jgi:hypothetical protein
MEKSKHLIVKLLIVFISVLSIDGGRSLLLTGNKIQVLLNHDHNEVEVPHQHQLLSLIDDEKWVETIKFDFSVREQCPFEFLYISKNTSQEFTDSIWQPPRFV